MQPISTTTDPAQTAFRQVFVFARPARTSGEDTLSPDTGERHLGHGPGAVYLVGHDGMVCRHTGGDPGPVPPALLGNYWMTGKAGGQEIPAAIRALQARDAALDGLEAEVDRFASEVLGLWRGGRWREPVTTALLGSWADPLGDGGLTSAFLTSFKAEVKEVHRALTPLWRRKVSGERLWSLDFSLRDDLTLYDLTEGAPDPYEALTGALPDNPRILAIFNDLTPLEQAVALEWANAQAGSWAGAAANVIMLDPTLPPAPDPVALGERVRRKLKRLGTQSAARAAAADTKDSSR
jgi:hypothetical protein